MQRLSKQPPNPVNKIKQKEERKEGRKEGGKVSWKKVREGSKKGQLYHRLQRTAGNFRIQTNTHIHIHRCRGDQWIHKTDFNSLLCTGCVTLGTHF